MAIAQGPGGGPGGGPGPGPGGGPPPLPPVPVPPQNPITEAKRVLGKILFWDEQLSSDNTVACGTCHRPEVGGVDPRFAVNPGLNGTLGNPDDVFGSFGVVQGDTQNDYIPDPTFGLSRQVTGRRSPDFTGSLFSPLQFWDGRAGPGFVNPDTGVLVIPQGGGLESQALAPILSDAEMAHTGRSFAQATSKLVNAKPLGLASNLPADVAAAIALSPTYPQLFQAAFGTTGITAQRIAFAIATYERTLVPNQTPFDAFIAGNPNALTPTQIQGLNAFNGPGRCDACHVPPIFSDSTFRNIGLRPIAEDNGRQAVTGNINDRGRFKVPSLRNVALRSRFFHNGQHSNLTAAVEEYDNSGGPFPDNRDPVLTGLDITPLQRDQIVAFLNSLTDPRVAAGLPPFDRPTLYSETVPQGSNVFGTAGAGSGGIAPQMIAHTPAASGIGDFRIAVGSALGGAPAWLALSVLTAPPATVVLGVDVYVDPATAVVTPVALNGAGAGGGYMTLHTSIPGDPGLIGLEFYAQWFVLDPAAPELLASSTAAEFTIF